MKVLLLSTEDNTGGAAKATFRLFEALKEAAVDVSMFSLFNRSGDHHVTAVSKTEARIKVKLEETVKKTLAGSKADNFSVGAIGVKLSQVIDRLKPDIIHLHWINNGFISIREIARINHPMVWTFHDMWALTGGCHYDAECGKYKTGCGQCPVLGSDRPNDLSNKLYKIKAKQWSPLNLQIVTPSTWLANCAASSGIFKDKTVSVIPYSLNLSVFRPVEKRTARAILNLPEDKKIIIFGAMSPTSDQRKGYHLLKPALDSLAETESLKDVELILFGGNKPTGEANLGFNVHYTGRLHDEITIALYYAAADVAVVPSLQDNLPNTVLEAMACGTPVVAFHTGGMPDMISHKENGYIAEAFDMQDLKNGMQWILINEEIRQRLSANARSTAEHQFHPSRQARAYIDLYRPMIRTR
jgi:glycosyltransferase involved in cell wall biosynthesis